MQQGSWDLHPDLALLSHAQRREILCLVLENADEAQAAALCDLGAFCAYRQGAYTALLYAKDAGFAGLDAIRAELVRMGLQAGLSGPFALAASARGCMLKAQLALKTGRVVHPGEALFSMDDYGEAALVRAAGHALRQQGFAAVDFCDASLWQMARTDAAKDTQYVKSLEAYLSCGMDMKRAAQELGVHRNTLAYRMERAQALFDLDFSDMSRCFELLFSLWLVRQLPDGDAAVQAPAAAPFDARAAQAALWLHMERSGLHEAAPSSGFSCALVCVGVSGMADDGRNALLMRIRGCAPQEAAFAFDEDVLFAVVAPDEMSAFAGRVLPVCKGLGCPMVTTQPFDASRIAQRARLCRMALCANAGTDMRDLCSTLFFMAVERRVSLAPYLCEDVIRVMDEDARKGTALSRSLYAYLLNFRDMKRAAQQLGMHRNTMEYHIRKIDALIGSDRGEQRRFMMMCTYKMLALPEYSRYGL